MRPRLAKELHPLLLPWLIAAVAAGAMPLLALLVGPAEGGTFTLFLLELITFAFFGALAVIAGLSFGAEFQQHTLGLLVSQPIERSRLWKEKMLALLAAATGIGLILWLSWGVGGLLLAEWGVWPDDREWVGKQLQRYFPDQALVLAATWLVATVCSGGFWSLLARSTIGGMVLNAASQGLLALGAVFALHQIYGTEFQFEDSIVTGVIIAAGLVYSATFLWLGWRKFALLELGDVSFGEGAPLSEALAGEKWWLGWLRCRPTGSLRNLMRKELRLLKPVFLIAAMFSGCWLVTLALLFLQPA